MPPAVTPPDAFAVRDTRTHHWFMVERRILEQYGPRIGVYGWAVYCALARYAGEAHTCYPSQGTLAKALGISRRKVNETLQLLEQVGLIRTVARTTPEGGTTSSLYYLLQAPDTPRTPCNAGEHPPVTLGNTPVPQSYTPCSPGAHPPVTHGNTKKTQFERDSHEGDMSGRSPAPAAGGLAPATGKTPKLLPQPDPKPDLPAKPTVPRSQQQALVLGLEQVLGYPIPPAKQAKEYVWAAKILGEGHPLAAVLACIRWMRAQPRWSRSLISLAVVYEQLPEYYRQFGPPVRAGSTHHPNLHTEETHDGHAAPPGAEGDEWDWDARVRAEAPQREGDMDLDAILREHKRRQGAVGDGPPAGGSPRA